MNITVEVLKKSHNFTTLNNPERNRNHQIQTFMDFKIALKRKVLI